MVRLRPRIPPLSLMYLAAALAPSRMGMPCDAAEPVRGPTMAMVIGPEPPPPLLLAPGGPDPQAATTRTPDTTADRITSVRRFALVRDFTASDLLADVEIDDLGV